jgi:dihydrofolate synthase/folylpolyglutamate synthase
VAGTNGKGSCVHLLDALLAARGQLVGRYTSPHLVHFRERIHVGGVPVADDALVAAFERVEAARGDIELSYFEVTTLAAFDVFRAARVDARVLEVGLGGRLDAVNVAASSGALLTNVGLDHQRWLGETREAIGREKAGVFRAGRPAIVATREPPDSVLRHAAEIDASLSLLGRDFHAEDDPAGWVWQGRARRVEALPDTGGAAQRDNVSGCLALLEALDLLPPDADVRNVVATAVPPARLELVPGAPQLLLDVAHNLESIARLCDWLAAHPVPGPTTLVMGVMADKPVDAMLARLAPAIERWVAVAAPGRRPLPADALAGRMAAATGAPALVAGSPPAGLRAARVVTPPDGRIVVAGSFPVVGAIRARL